MHAVERGGDRLRTVQVARHDVDARGQVGACLVADERPHGLARGREHPDELAARVAGRAGHQVHLASCSGTFPNIRSERTVPA